jgi:ribosomal protein S18 acetylase RimI-like enzyme
VDRHERIERSTWDLFWLPDEATAIDRPELMAVHASRPLRHLNAVYRTRAPAARLPALIAEIEPLHRRFGSRWTVADTVDVAALEEALDAAGYAPVDVHDARVIAVADFALRPVAGVEVRRVDTEAALRDCWRVNEIAFGRDGDYTERDVAIELAQCAGESGRVHRFVGYDGGEPVCSAGINLYPDHRFGFLWGGGTVPAARGKGIYSAVVAARVAAAVARGIDFVGLYARVGSSSPIVARQGFDAVGRMTYWET